MVARLITRLGQRVSLRVYWGSNHACPGRMGYHNAMRLIGEEPPVDGHVWDRDVSAYRDAAWPDACGDCGAPVPPGYFLNTIGDSAVRPQYQVFRKTLFDTPSGEPEAGTVYFAPWMHRRPRPGAPLACQYWDNCQSARGHLFVVLPDGHVWDADGRAANCTRPHNRLHRCWVLHGTAPLVTVDKTGDTCGTGALILSPRGWHGTVVDGVFKEV